MKRLMAEFLRAARREAAAETRRIPHARAADVLPYVAAARRAGTHRRAHLVPMQVKHVVDVREP